MQWAASINNSNEVGWNPDAAGGYGEHAGEKNFYEEDWKGW